jgi:hypothetical protein
MKVLVQVEVEIEPETCEFVSIKVGDEQACPLPKTAPAPRRLAKDLATAAVKALQTTRD